MIGWWSGGRELECRICTNGVGESGKFGKIMQLQNSFMATLVEWVGERNMYGNNVLTDWDALTQRIDHFWLIFLIFQSFTDLSQFLSKFSASGVTVVDAYMYVDSTFTRPIHEVMTERNDNLSVISKLWMGSRCDLTTRRTTKPRIYREVGLRSEANSRIIADTDLIWQQTERDFEEWTCTCYYQWEG